ncbi:MAG: three-Cys-motif partner protein TcmP [Anaerolineae bacterium]|nr:three-Cys-motif partner protein TcmP [Anaerolineae bacterium]
MASKSYNQRFGGDWTEIKLQKVAKYLKAYTTIMQRQKSINAYAYIDAFAGTGYRKLASEEISEGLLLPEFLEEDSQRFLDGSARIALKVEPRFTKYIFIEKDAERFEELKKLKQEFPALSDDIMLEQEDANSYLLRFCGRDRKWMINHGRRAVLFLDPFGMQVEWKTLEAIAETQAIDLWLLFPLGVAVNRMLRKDGQIPEKWQHRLTTLFGTSDWVDTLYKVKTERTLFGEQTVTQKVDDPFASIGNYFVARLKSIFPGVADNPLPLYNSKNNPLYLLCFASANPKGSKTAINIAQDILRR